MGINEDDTMRIFGMPHGATESAVIFTELLEDLRE
jgi:hypothetical protein